MRDDVARDLSASSFDFQRAVWPLIADLWFGGGELVPNESSKASGFSQDMDILAGVDYWVKNGKEGMIYSLATRVQWGRAYNTFTIRYERRSGAKTEYEKRASAYEEKNKGVLSPGFTLHAYMTEPRREGQVLSVAKIHTQALYRVAAMIVEKSHRGERSRDWRMQEVKSGGAAIFLAINWGYFDKVNEKVDILFFNLSGNLREDTSADKSDILRLPDPLFPGVCSDCGHSLYWMTWEDNLSCGCCNPIDANEVKRWIRPYIVEKA